MKAFRHLILAMGLVAATAVHAEERGVVALVNDEPINASQLQRGVDAVLRQEGTEIGAIRNPDKMTMLRSQVLDQLIAQRLLWQEARDKQILAADADVDEVVARIRGNMKDERQFQLQLDNAGLTEEQYRQDVMQRLSVRMLIRDDITKDVTVSEEEISNYYSQNTERFRQPPEVRVRHILVKVAPDAPDAEVEAARKQIDAVLELALKEGADFAQLATEHSQGPSAAKGGDLGFLRHEQLVKPFADVAFALEPGDISSAVRTQFGFHLIQMEERRGGDLVAEAEAAPQIREYLTALKSRQRIADRVQRLRDAGKIEVVGL